MAKVSPARLDGELVLVLGGGFSSEVGDTVHLVSRGFKQIAGSFNKITVVGYEGVRWTGTVESAFRLRQSPCSEPETYALTALAARNDRLSSTCAGKRKSKLTRIQQNPGKKRSQP